MIRPECGLGLMGKTWVRTYIRSPFMKTSMFKIKGNREFWQWWEHWTSRLYSERHPQPNSVDKGENQGIQTRTKPPKKTADPKLGPEFLT